MEIEFSDWSVIESKFLPEKINHSETIFTLGNGYLGTRGSFEEYYPGEVRSTFLHGVFDDLPIVFTELANIPDWTELEVYLNGERFSLAEGKVLGYERSLDLRTATLRRDVHWESASGLITNLLFERFASLDDIHLCGLKISITPENYEGVVEVRSGLNGQADNLGYKHWEWLDQSTAKNTAWLHCCTRSTNIELAMGFSQRLQIGTKVARNIRWDVSNYPSMVSKSLIKKGETAVAQKWVTVCTARDGKSPLDKCRRYLNRLSKLDWESAYSAHCAAWEKEWEICDVLIEGDPEAQLGVRFNIFQLLIAGPRHDERVNIGAKTLSGYGYRGHSFWDTEIFMLPFFTYTRPEIAHNLLSYRWHNLPGARNKAEANGYLGAQYPWESAATGEEVTPTWVPDPDDRTGLIRIWTGDIEIHISADISFAMWQYWKASQNDDFMADRAAEVIIETARFWASRVEWQEGMGRFEITDIIGPDEYHDHVDNNVYTNAMARWNLQTAIEVIDWMKSQKPGAWKRLSRKIKFSSDEISRWNHIIERIYVHYDVKSRLIEQFQGYFNCEDVDLKEMEPRDQSMQSILGIEGVSKTQIIKQPDVLMLMYLLPDLYDQKIIEKNFNYYAARTDITYGSSLGPSIQAIMACRVGNPQSYEHFMRAARADLYDVRNNAMDGIHGASAGGVWQAIVFGFGGLHQTDGKWRINPALPENWTRLSFQVVVGGEVMKFDIRK